MTAPANNQKKNQRQNGRGRLLRTIFRSIFFSFCFILRFFLRLCVCVPFFFNIFLKNISFVLIKIFVSTLGISADRGQFWHFSFFFQYFFSCCFLWFFTKLKIRFRKKKIQKFRNFLKNSINGQRRRNSLSCRYFLPKIM